MKNLGIFLLSLLLALACTSRSTGNPQSDVSSLSDSVVVNAEATDSLVQSEPEPPLAADGLFDDFIFNFMRNKRFQLERVRFPLPCMTDSVVHLVRRDQWKHEKLYSTADIYVMLFDDAASLNTPKDTAVKVVVVEMFDFKKNRVRDFRFHKQRGAWQLVALWDHTINQGANADFDTFYRRFVTDAVYRRKHVTTPFALTITDPDTFETLQGTADAAQWDDYAPEMPREGIVNVNYAQRYAATGQRVLLVSSTDGSLTSTITFKKRGSQWYATRLENS